MLRIRNLNHQIFTVLQAAQANKMPKDTAISLDFRLVVLTEIRVLACLERCHHHGWLGKALGTTWNSDPWGQNRGCGYGVEGKAKMNGTRWWSVCFLQMFIIYTYISLSSDKERQNWNVIKNWLSSRNTPPESRTTCMSGDLDEIEWQLKLKYCHRFPACAQDARSPGWNLSMLCPEDLDEWFRGCLFGESIPQQSYRTPLPGLISGIGRWVKYNQIDPIYTR